MSTQSANSIIQRAIFFILFTTTQDIFSVGTTIHRPVQVDDNFIRTDIKHFPETTRNCSLMNYNYCVFVRGHASRPYTTESVKKICF